MDIGKAFGFVFEDENWVVKVLIGGVVSLIPFVGQILVFGYGLELMKNVIHNESRPLPEWDDWGGKLIKGIMYWVIQFVYALPLIIVVACFGILMAITGATGSEDAVSIVGTGGGICIGGFALLYGILVTLVTPTAVGRYLETDELGAAFRFGEVFALVRDNVVAWIIALVIAWVAALIASLGIILCVVGVLFTTFWASVVSMYLWGDTYRQASAKAVAV